MLCFFFPFIILVLNQSEECDHHVYLFPSIPRLCVVLCPQSFDSTPDPETGRRELGWHSQGQGYPSIPLIPSRVLFCVSSHFCSNHHFHGLRDDDECCFFHLFQSDQCTLILTEGDSAKALAVAGLSIIGESVGNHNVAFVVFFFSIDVEK